MVAPLRSILLTLVLVVSLTGCVAFREIVREVQVIRDDPVAAQTISAVGGAASAVGGPIAGTAAAGLATLALAFFSAKKKKDGEG